MFVGKWLWLGSAVSVCCGLGCRRSTPSVIPSSALPTVAVAVKQPIMQQPLPLHLTRAQVTESLLAGKRRRILGHRSTLDDIRRIVIELNPILEEASRQAAVQPVFTEMGFDEGLSAEEARKQWIALQEADLLLESGGDPNAISPSNACGVAQWMAGTGQGVGLKIRLRDSERLTRKIQPLAWQVAWLNYLSLPNADPAAPGAPPISPAEAATRLPAAKAELAMLIARRRGCDARFDPRQAIFAQTRYLMKIYKRFPRSDWLFQAYHGGEGGVTRTLKLYLGSAYPGSPAGAIRFGQEGHWLPFEDVYFNTTPTSHPKAFDYLYGRSDDHRHYWWKLRASQMLLADYRRDPAGFEKEWLEANPGAGMAVAWYPNAPAEALTDDPALTAAVQSGRLVSAKPTPFPFHPTTLPQEQTARNATLRPETKDALKLLAATYRQLGGQTPVEVGDMTLTQQMIERNRQLHPPRPPKSPPYPPEPELPISTPKPPPGFDFHTTGLTFDLIRPTSDSTRKRLEYALGWLEDRQILWLRDEKDRPPRRYHIVPNPIYADALARYVSP